MQGNPQYLERKKEKQARYARTTTPCVEWTPQQNWRRYDCRPPLDLTADIIAIP